MKYKVLIVDDEPNALTGLKWTLKKKYDVFLANCGEKALEIIKSEKIDVALLDISMPGMDGIELLEHVKAYNSNIVCIMVSAKNKPDVVGDAYKKGAKDYIEKPIDPKKLKSVLEAIVNQKKLQDQIYEMKKVQTAELKYFNALTQTPSMRSVVGLITKLKGSDSYILIEGEHGTGKEIIAKAIHGQEQADKGFYIINCGSLSGDLLDDELFGHEKGAYTSAVKSKAGIFEIANGGDIYMDNVDELPLPAQVKLLRVLQEKKVKRIGGTKDIEVRFRLIASASSNLKEKVKTGMFREDLYYRINVINIKVPTLRSRIEDIPFLANYFVLNLSKGKKSISHEAIEIFKAFDWPGNIKQLQNTIETLVTTTDSDIIQRYDIPHDIRFDLNKVQKNITKLGLKPALEKIEKNLIIQALMDNDWAIGKTAESLNVHRNRLRDKINAYGIKKPNSKELRDGIRNLFIPHGYDYETWDVQKYINNKQKKNIWNEIYQSRGFKNEKDGQKHFLKTLEKFSKLMIEKENDKKTKEELRQRAKRFIQDLISSLLKQRSQAQKDSPKNNTKISRKTHRTLTNDKGEINEKE